MAGWYSTYTTRSLTFKIHTELQYRKKSNNLKEKPAKDKQSMCYLQVTITENPSVPLNLGNVPKYQSTNLNGDKMSVGMWVNRHFIISQI